LKIPTAALRFRPADAPVTKGGRGKGMSQLQTIYVLDDQGKPKPVQVKLGIGDGTFTAVVSGDLAEGQMVVTGIASKSGTTTTSAPGQQPAGRGRGPGF